MSSEQPSEEELRAALEEQMRHIRVEDVLVQTLVTLINLGARRLGLAGSPEEAGEADPAQARLAIDGARALMDLVPQEGLEQVRDALSQLQMAYAREAGGAEPAAEQAAGPGAEQPSGDRPPEEGRGPAQSSGRLWVPGQ